MQFKIVKNPQIQPDTQNNLTTHTNKNVGYVLYNDNTKKEIKDLTEDELIEIFSEYIETYNASNEPYINIEKFAIYNNFRFMIEEGSSLWKTLILLISILQKAKALPASPGIFIRARKCAAIPFSA